MTGPNSSSPISPDRRSQDLDLDPVGDRLSQNFSQVNVRTTTNWVVDAADQISTVGDKLRSSCPTVEHDR